MLKAIFADEESLGKLSKYGLASGVIFALMTFVVYDRMVDTDNPDGSLLPLVALLAFLTMVIVITSIWFNHERRRMAYDNMLELAKLSGVDSIEKLKQFFEVDTISGVIVPELTLDLSDLDGELLEAQAVECEDELITRFVGTDGLPDEYDIVAFREATRPVVRRLLQGNTIQAGQPHPKLQINWRRL